MIITLIIVGLFIFSIAFEIWYENGGIYGAHMRRINFEVLQGIAIFNIIVGGIISLVICAYIISARVNKTAQIEALNEQRATIVYQIENETYKNPNNVGTNGLMRDIAEFNGRVITNQGGLNNPWISWFYSPIWNEIKLIEY